jgi:hypothetical protein
VRRDCLTCDEDVAAAEDDDVGRFSANGGDRVRHRRHLGGDLHVPVLFEIGPDALPNDAIRLYDHDFRDHARMVERSTLLGGSHTRQLGSTAELGQS